MIIRNIIIVYEGRKDKERIYREKKEYAVYEQLHLDAIKRAYL